MIRRPPRSTPLYSSAASDVYKRQFPCAARILQKGRQKIRTCVSLPQTGFRQHHCYRFYSCLRWFFAAEPRVRLSIHTTCALTRDGGCVGLWQGLSALPGARRLHVVSAAQKLRRAGAPATKPKPSRRLVQSSNRSCPGPERLARASREQRCGNCPGRRAPPNLREGLLYLSLIHI